MILIGNGYGEDYGKWLGHKRQKETKMGKPEIITEESSIQAAMLVIAQMQKRIDALECGDIEQELYDVYDDDDTPTIKASVTGTTRGISVKLEGFGNLAGDAEVVLIENVEGTPKVVIWGDKNKEDPTDIIPLEDAKL